VHDPLSPGGKIGPGATLGSLEGLASGARFDMVSGESFDADKAYKDSKLCNVLFAEEMARRLSEEGSQVTVNSFAPGASACCAFGAADAAMNVLPH
jgi:protochlorophyllide reductase